LKTANKQKSQLKALIESWNLWLNETDFYKVTESNRANYDVKAVCELVWDDSINYLKVDWTKLKKDWKLKSFKRYTFMRFL
jgi:hypothetical protein